MIGFIRQRIDKIHFRRGRKRTAFNRRFDDRVVGRRSRFHQVLRLDVF